MKRDPKGAWLRRHHMLARGIPAHFRDAVRSWEGEGNGADREEAVTLSLRAAERLCRELIRAIPECPR